MIRELFDTEVEAVVGGHGHGHGHGHKQDGSIIGALLKDLVLVNGTNNGDVTNNGTNSGTVAGEIINITFEL